MSVIVFCLHTLYCMTKEFVSTVHYWVLVGFFAAFVSGFIDFSSFVTAPFFAVLAYASTVVLRSVIDIFNFLKGAPVNE